MSNEIEVGEYVRTNKGNIGQVIGIFNGHCQAKYHIQFQGKVKVKRQYLSTHTIIKHSKQLIDLIEVGDIVNGYRVINVINEGLCPSGKCVDIDSSKDSSECTLWENDIQIILTKEQFEANCYKVGGRE